MKHRASASIFYFLLLVTYVAGQNKEQWPLEIHGEGSPILYRCLYVFFICTDYVGTWPDNKFDCYEYYTDCLSKSPNQESNLILDGQVIPIDLSPDELPSSQILPSDQSNNPTGQDSSSNTPNGDNISTGGNPTGGNPTGGNPTGGNPTGGIPTGGNPNNNNPNGLNPDTSGGLPDQTNSIDNNPDIGSDPGSNNPDNLGSTDSDPANPDFNDSNGNNTGGNNLDPSNPGSNNPNTNNPGSNNPDSSNPGSDGADSNNPNSIDANSNNPGSMDSDSNNPESGSIDPENPDANDSTSENADSNGENTGNSNSSGENQINDNNPTGDNPINSPNNNNGNVNEDSINNPTGGENIDEGNPNDDDNAGTFPLDTESNSSDNLDAGNLDGDDPFNGIGNGDDDFGLPDESISGDNLDADNLNTDSGDNGTDDNSTDGNQNDPDPNGDNPNETQNESLTDEDNSNNGDLNENTGDDGSTENDDVLQDGQVRSCHQHLQNGALESGEYVITLNGRTVTVYCDMETEGGGWTILQRRGDYGRGKNFFLRSWDDYRKGFGDPMEDFWLGLENMHQLTKNDEVELLIELEDFENNRTSLLVNNFTVGNEENGFKISYKNYNSKIGNSLPARGTKFSTIDMDNDAWKQNCAKRFSGAWWYSACHNSNLNGLYLEGKHESFGNGVNWYHWKGYHYSLKNTQMKVRPTRANEVAPVKF